MSQYQLIVFDWDGTLMDSTGHIVNCIKQASIMLDFPILSDKTIRHIIGLGLQEALRTLYPQESNERREHLATTYREVWRTTPEQTPLFDHAEQLIKYLAQQDFFLAVATGKSRRGLDRILDNTGLGSHFHITRCPDECHSKPHPQMLEQIMDYCGVEAQHTLMIGDTEFDLLMAQNANVDSLGISHGAHDVELLQTCNPQSIVDDLQQVQQFISKSI